MPVPTVVSDRAAAESAIDQAALQALRLLPDEPQRAMALYAQAHARALALGYERGLLRLRIVTLNEQARFGDRAAAAAGIAEVLQITERRPWVVESLLIQLLGLFMKTLLDDHAGGARDAEALQAAAEQHLDAVELSWLDIMTGHFRGYLLGWAEEQRTAYLALNRLVGNPAAPPGLIANTKKNIGYSHLLVQNLDLAQSFLRDAYQLYAPLPLTPRKLSALKSWAQCLLAFGDAQEADAVLTPVLVARADIPSSMYLASALLVGAEVKLLIGDSACAETYCQHAAGTLNAAQEPAILTHLAYVRSLLLQGAGKPEAALAAAQQGCDLMTAHTHEVAVQKCLALAARLYAEAGNFERAYALQSSLLALRGEMARKAGVIRHVELHIDHQAQIGRIELAHVRQAQQLAEAAELAIAKKNAELERRLTDVEQLQETLREHANRDALTGLFNRRYLRAAFPTLLSQTARTHAPIALALLDIDHFKQVNDQYGHQMGDAVLVKLAELMLSHFRGHDMCCRYGGEEFCVVMVGIAAASARLRLETLLVEFGLMVVRDGDMSLSKLSFSAGLISCQAGPAFDLDGAFRMADAALYEAKDAGRGRVVVARAGVQRALI